MNGNKGAQEMKKDIYLNLAEFMNEPSKGHYELIQSGKFEEMMQRLFAQVSYEYPQGVVFHDIFADEGELQQAYIHCISGHVKSTTLPIESCFKPWTTDQESDMYNLKGYLLGDSAEHMRYLFDQYKLELPAAFLSAPDHLILLLEFLAYLIEHRTNAEIEQFLVDHFDWLPELYQRLEDNSDCRYYKGLVALVIRATTDELKHLNELRGENIEK